MYNKSTKKVSRISAPRVTLILFVLLAVLYFPVGGAAQESDVSPRSISVSESDFSLPKSWRAEITVTTVQALNNYRAWKGTESLKLTSPEFKINGYIDQIVSEFYPQLDSTVIKAIVYNESRYNPDSVNSSSGTMGLMQISPKWHTKRAANLGVTDLLDAYGNILVGCDILAEVTRETGSFSYALDVFAGGYPYANSYINSVSPARRNISETVSLIQSGAISF